MTVVEGTLSYCRDMAHIITVDSSCSCLAMTLLQVCARGFFLSEQETCLPCNCKGHTDSCEDITGICIVSISFKTNCKY